MRITVADDDLGQTTFTTTADANGSWTLELTDVASQLTIDHEDTLTISVSATDGVNNVSTFAAVTWTVDAIADEISLTIDEEDRDPDSGGAFSINATAGLSGSAEGDAVIRVTVADEDGGETTFTTTADSAGSWTLGLADVTNQLTIDHMDQLTVNVSATDGVNNVATFATLTWTVDSVAQPISLTIDDEDRDPDSGGAFSINATAGLSGSAEAGAVVRVTVADEDGGQAVFASTADAAGSWTLELQDVATQLTIDHDDQLTVSYTVTDVLGNAHTQDIGTWTVDGVTSPINLTIDDEDFDVDALTNTFSINATAGISGSTEADAIVRITVADDDLGQTTFTTTADSAGSWTLELTDVASQLTIDHEDTLTISVSATDGVNNVANYAVVTWTVDAIADDISLTIDEEDRDPDSGGAFSINATAGFAGSAEGDAVIRVTVADEDGGETTFTTTADSAGSWTLELADVTSELTIDHMDLLTVNVSATDGVNNVSTFATLTWTVDSIAQPISLTIDEEDRDPDSGGAFSINATAGLSGSAEAGAVVRVTVADEDGGQAVFASTADAAGSWTLELQDVATQLTIDHDDQLTVSYTVTDVLGNAHTQDIGTWTVDGVTSPINLTIDDEDFDVDALTNTFSINATAGISGSTEADVIVRITVADDDFGLTTFTTTSDANGSWTLELTDVASQLTIDHEDTLTISVSATDGVNNIATYAAVTWTVDAIADEISLTIDEEDRDPDSGGAFSINATAGFSGSAEGDAVIRVTVADEDGGETTFTTTADSAGSWTLELADVTNQLTIDHMDLLTVNVSATDGVNNVSTFATVTWTVDSVAQPISLTIDDEDRDPDTGGVFSINATAGLSGSSEAGSVVRITVADEDGGQAVFTSTADAAGSWTLELQDVAGQLTIDHEDQLTVSSSFTDAVGNVSDLDFGTWTVDAVTSPINLTIDDEDFDLDAGVNTFSINATAGISGSTEIYSVVRITVADDDLGQTTFTTTADANGSWTLELQDVASELTIDHEDKLTISVSATDGVNNVSTFAAVTWTVDAIADDISLTIDEEDRDPDSSGVFSINATAGLSGSAEGDAVIRVTVGDDDLGLTTFTTTADSAGSWTLELQDVTNQLTIDHDDQLTINVSATDGVNNVSTLPTVTWTVDSVVQPLSLTIDGYDREPDQGDPYSINATAGLSGSAEAGAVIRMTIADEDGGEAVFTTTSDANGSWTLELQDVAGQLTIDHEDQLTVTSTVTDRVGNVDTQDFGTWTVDSVTSPINLTIDDEDFDTDIGTSSFSINATAGISGSTEADVIVRVTVADEDGGQTTFTTTSDANGSWTLELQDVASELTIDHEDQLTVSVSATDGVNNVSTYAAVTWSVDAVSSALQMTIDEEDRDPDSGGVFSINDTAGFAGSAEADAVIRVTVAG